MRLLLAIGALGMVMLASAHTFAEPEAAHAVALLPLDADAKLELYGQPVASEVSRALVQDGIEVVVVDGKNPVPANARLIVDGTIKSDKGGSVTLTMRIRDSRNGTVYATLDARAPTMTGMDHAAEQLSAKVLPSVKAQLAKLIEADKALANKDKVEIKPDKPPVPAVTLAAMIVAVHAKPTASPSVALLRTELATALTAWAARRHHEPHTVDAKLLAGKAAPKAVVAGKAELALDLDVLALDVSTNAAQVPLATARVHVRISDAQSVVFDRVIVTDTIVGEKGLDPTKLADRVAREVLAIADPHLRRRIATWW